MISNLPLLFADGYPTCLDKITVSQLEKFVPFMVQCSNGNNSVNSSVPEWWPDNLEFSLPVVKPPGMDEKWSAVLKSLVCRCYSYHGCDFMLQFSEALSQCAVSSLRFVDGRDGTTSLYSKVTGKLLVTFRNENMLYDKKRDSPKKTLLSRKYEEPEQSHLMVQPPLFDIYLCENCDGEFSSLKEMQYHEKVCHLEIQNSALSNIAEDLNTDQEKFLNYFSLSSSSSTKELKSVIKTDNTNFKKTVGGSWRYAGIPFSSPLGLLVHRKIQGTYSMKVERNCPAKPSDCNVNFCRRRSPSWIVSWKPPEKSEEVLDNWVHLYKYPKGRSWRNSTCVQNCSRNKKLYGLCQNVQVKLKRLTQREIDLYTSPSGANFSSMNLPVSAVNYELETNHLNDAECKLGLLLSGDLVINKANDFVQEFLPIKEDLAEETNCSNDCDYKFNSVESTVRTFQEYQEFPKLVQKCDSDNKNESENLKKHIWTTSLETIPVISLISSDEESEDI